MNRWNRFFGATQNPNKHIAEWCKRVRLYARSCGVSRFTIPSDQEWLIHWVMSNGLKNGKVADKYFAKLKNIETDINEKNIKQVQDDFVRSEYTISLLRTTPLTTCLSSRFSQAGHQGRTAIYFHYFKKD